MRGQVSRANTGSHGETATWKTRRDWDSDKLLRLSSQQALTRSCDPASTIRAVFTGLSAGTVERPGCPLWDPSTQHSLAHGGSQLAWTEWVAGLWLKVAGCAAPTREGKSGIHPYSLSAVAYRLLQARFCSPRQLQIDHLMIYSSSFSPFLLS